ncbi:ThuA domain-containing protein [Dactylosporangium matsuzakiense]|uniref:Glycosyl hydrolase n=1 Tax=Dactylosporangium matsuzakiense TaxID=53360 RepID=A0A9W6NKR6_9ACTN|nr:ThuA domain-containing protein [Dactylosporangium matsuzakiense]UWZ45601.1 ThuA domain-containing protein [Dactylosporangium matsuzakiense]GLL00386.1 glycosyl hydrolase [Dactylosporangium matsuzakiense]
MTRLTLLSAALLLAGAFVATPAQAADSAYDVLVFSKTAGFRHDAIPAGIQAVRDLGAANNFTVTATEDAAAFTTANLAQYEAVVFMSTTGDVLNDAQQTAFESYIRGGGGYVGVHAAADTEYGWPFYGQLVGAWFASHPAIQQVNSRTEDRANPATAHLPQTWTRTDELYNYQTNPRSTAHVLATLDESSYSGGTMGGDHPITWCKTIDAGRSFYTGFGHTQESYSDSLFRTELLGGIRYASKRAQADCRPETGYTALYNGSTTGWSQAGPGSFTNADATLSSTGGLGLFWYSTRQFGTSYSLKADFRITGDSNSGVYVGFPNPGNDPNIAINQGYEIQIDATDTPDHTTGAIYNFQSANIAARDAALNPPGAWNTYEILVEGQRLRVYLNSVLINDFTNTDPARNLDGYIGIQNHGSADQVSFRNIRIREGSASSDVVQAELFSAASGVQPYTKAGAHNGQTLGYIEPGDWAAYNGLNIGGATSFKARVVSGGPGGQIQIRTGSTTGPVLGTVNVANTGGWDTYADVSTALTGVPTATANVYLTFTGTGTGLFDLDDFTFVKAPAVTSGPVKGLAGKCLDVRGAASADGTQIQLYTCNGSAAQTWTVSGQTLRALGKCLDVSGGGTADGTKIQLWTCNGSGAQNWASQADGSLRNPQSNKCLDVAGGVSTDSTIVQLYTCNGSAAQKWTLPA